MRIAGYAGEGRIKAERTPDDPRPMVLLARGSGRPLVAEIGGTRYRSSGFSDLRVAFVPEGADARMEYHPAARNLSILFAPGLLPAHVPHRQARGFAPLLFNNDPTLIALMAWLEMELVAPSFASDLRRDALLHQLARKLAGLGSHEPDPASRSISIAPVRLKRVIDFIDAHLAQPLTLEQLADVAGLSVFHFARVFRQATGQSPYRFVSERRLMLAQRLLMAREMTVQDIALACGFTRHASFSAAFARARGMSPRHYRRRFAL